MARHALLLLLCLSIFPTLAVSAQVLPEPSDSPQPTLGRPPQKLDARVSKPEDDEPVISVGTQLLQLDVIVTGKTPVGTLRREDFELLEDGKPKDIAFFSVVRAGRMTGGDTLPETNAGETAAGRTFALVVDDIHISPTNMAYLKKALRELVEKKLAPGDRLMILTTSGNLGLLQRLTDNRKVLLAIVEKLSAKSRLRGSEALTPYLAQRILLNDQEALAVGVARYNRVFPLPPGEAGLNELRMFANTVVQENEASVKDTVSTIRIAIRALAGLPGRKALLLASDGIFTSRIDGNRREQVRSVVDSATRAGVTIYSIASGGIETGGPDASVSGVPDAAEFRVEGAERVSKFDAMTDIALDTGGLLIPPINDLGPSFDRALADNERYYVLAYYPETRPDGRFHKIEVRVKNLPGVKIRTRAGYVSPDEAAIRKAEAKAAERQKKRKAVRNDGDAQRRILQQAVFGLVPPTDISIRIASYFVANDAPTAFSIAFNPHELVSGRKMATLVTAFTISDLDGKVLTATEERISLKITASLEGLSQGFWISRIKGQILKPGLYDVRFAVLDPETERTGVASRWIEIPDLTKKEMGLSDILFLRPIPPGRPGRSTRRGSIPPGYEPAIQSLADYRTTQDLAFLVRVHQPPTASTPDSSPLSVQIQLFRGEELVTMTAPRRTATVPAPNTPFDYAGNLPLAGLQPGDYTLKIIAFDTATHRTATQTAGFRVEK